MSHTMSIKEAYAAIKSGIVRNINGKRPIGIGRIDAHRTVLLFTRPSEEHDSCFTRDGVTEYTHWNVEAES